MKKWVLGYLLLIQTSMGVFAVSQEDLRKIYLWPKYKQQTVEQMIHFLGGETFDQWDYGNIYDRTPAKYAEKIGAKHAFFCSSGTSGLHASLIALGLKRGDRVAVPAMTFIRSVTPLTHMGIEPVLVDIDPHTGNLDPESLSKLHDERIKAVIAVHMWGVPCDMEAIQQIAEEKGWYLIEDFSHAHFSRLKSGCVGTFGAIGFASLQRKKTLSVGEGGLIVTNDEAIFRRVRQIVSPGSYDPLENGMDHSGYGLNMRMSPFSVIIADSLIGSIDEIIETRSGSAEILLDMMRKYPDVFEVPPVADFVEKVSWYAIRVKTKVPLSFLKKAAKGTRWKFDSLEYPMISDHLFWKKDSTFFPFSEKLQPIYGSETFPGAEAYMSGRISVKLPSLSPEEWTEEMIGSFEKELAHIVETVKIMEGESRVENEQTHKELEHEINQLFVGLGKLAKQFLVNSDYKRKEFVPNADWEMQLGQIASRIEKLMDFSKTSLSASIGVALEKYAKRKRVGSEEILKLKECSSESEFLSAALQYSYELFGVSTLEGDLLDLVSEVCELKEEFLSQSTFEFTENWYSELADVAYLLLRLQKHPSMKV